MSSGMPGGDVPSHQLLSLNPNRGRSSFIQASPLTNLRSFRGSIAGGGGMPSLLVPGSDAGGARPPSSAAATRSLGGGGASAGGAGTSVGAGAGGSSVGGGTVGGPGSGSVPAAGAAPAAESGQKPHMTVLMHAVLRKELKLVKWLCRHARANPNQKDEFGLTATHYACQCNHLPELKYLHKLGGANMEARDATGMTPLLTAVASGSKDCVLYLIREAFCNLLATDNCGRNALMRCCMSNQLEMAKWLVTEAGFRQFVNSPAPTAFVAPVPAPPPPPPVAFPVVPGGHPINRVRVLAEDNLPAGSATVAAGGDVGAPPPLVGGGTVAGAGASAVGAGGTAGTLGSLPAGAAGPSITGPGGVSFTFSAAGGGGSLGGSVGGDGPASPGASNRSRQPGANARRRAQRTAQALAAALTVSPDAAAAAAASAGVELTEESKLVFQGSRGSSRHAGSLHGSQHSSRAGSPGPGPAWPEWSASDSRPHLSPSPERSPGQSRSDLTLTLPGDEEDGAGAGSPGAPGKGPMDTDSDEDGEDGEGGDGDGGDAGADDAPSEPRPDIEASFPGGCTALMMAAVAGHLQVVKWLVKQAGASPGAVNERGHQAWRMAAAAMQFRVFEWLFCYGNASLEDEDKLALTLLVQAAKEGNTDLVIQLVGAGSDLDAQDQTGKTALMWSALGGFSTIGTALMEAGARLDLEDNDGRDAQMLAVAASQWAMVRQLEDRAEEVARQAEEAAAAAAGRAVAGNDVAEEETVDWNSVMQEAQAEECDVVDYANRNAIPLHRLDKSGRSFLQHVALNGRLDQVRVLVEKGQLNVKTKQTKAFRMHARGTKGLDAMQMALSKKWFATYNYLFLHHALLHDARPMDRVVARASDVFPQFDRETIVEMASFASEYVPLSQNPIVTCLRLAWLFTAAGDADRIHRHLYQEEAEAYTQQALDLFHAVPFPALHAWVLEEPDALNHTVVQVAVSSGNAAFLADAAVDKAVSQWWLRSDLPPASITQPLLWLSRPAFRAGMEQAALVIRVILFTVFLLSDTNVSSSGFTVIEVICYIFTVGQMLPPLPPSTKRINISSGSLHLIRHTRAQNAAAAAAAADGGADAAAGLGSSGRGPGSVASPSSSLTMPSMQPSIHSLRMASAPIASAAPTPMAAAASVAAVGAGAGADRSPKARSGGAFFSLPQMSLGPGPAPSVSLGASGSSSAGGVSLGSFSPGSDSAGALLLSPASRALLGRAAAGAPAAKALQVAALEGAAAAGALGNPTGSGGGDGGGGADQDDLRTEEEERALKAWRRKRNKQSTRWELFVLHLTSDGWAFTDFIIALLIFVVLVLRFAYNGRDATMSAQIVFNSAMSLLTVLFYARLLEIFISWESLGPMLIMIFKMITDVKHFLIFFVLSTGSFMLVTWFLARSDTPTGPVAEIEGFENLGTIFATVWAGWWGNFPFEAVLASDDSVRIILVVLGVLVTFTFSTFLMNLLIGIMSNTLSDVASNARAEFASHLVRRRWIIDQSAFELPSPLNLVHLLLLQIVRLLRVAGFRVFDVPVPAADARAAKKDAAAAAAAAAAAKDADSAAAAAAEEEERVALLQRLGSADGDDFDASGAAVELRPRLESALSVGGTLVPTAAPAAATRSTARARAAAHKRRYVCAYCHYPWTNSAFSITRPASDVEKRFPAPVLYEFNQQEAGRRLCRFCLRAQRVLTERQYESERLAMIILVALVFPLALLGWTLFVWPLGKLLELWRHRKSRAEDMGEQDRYYAVVDRTPYSYTFFAPPAPQPEGEGGEGDQSMQGDTQQGGQE